MNTRLTGITIDAANAVGYRVLVQKKDEHVIKREKSLDHFAEAVSWAADAALHQALHNRTSIVHVEPAWAEGKLSGAVVRIDAESKLAYTEVPADDYVLTCSVLDPAKHWQGIQSFAIDGAGQLIQRIGVFLGAGLLLADAARCIVYHQGFEIFNLQATGLVLDK